MKYNILIDTVLQMKNINQHIWMQQNVLSIPHFFLALSGWATKESCWFCICEQQSGIISEVNILGEEGLVLRQLVQAVPLSEIVPLDYQK